MHRRALLTLGVLAALPLLPAFAEPRVFPPEAKRGALTPGWFPDITLDGKPRRLAPAARIFNQDNLVELPAALRGRDLPVYYTENGDGDVDRVWLLTPAESRQRQRPGVARQ
ncbi:hypothetical protein [Pseudoduganella chitinolytica]|uniref:Uncharacterized protein n=1 Tax=Pseudoduganella chitinolytica TaxID=34070 RepID=A0ABY8BAW3_9BURK|nr:hypothetical protein [Pseudoduganella chitinolytica]WEF32920.1 hypothetical protein PX653_26585 [Pseudoduganella chitinolytica]